MSLKKEENEGVESYTQLGQSSKFDNTSLSPVPGKYRVMRRNGKVTSFDLNKIVKSELIIEDIPERKEKTTSNKLEQ